MPEVERALVCAAKTMSAAERRRTKVNELRELFVTLAKMNESCEGRAGRNTKGLQVVGSHPNVVARSIVIVFAYKKRNFS